MQEHIRRAHPQHYISKLPASAESIRAMVEKIPDEIPPSQQTSPQQLSQNTHAIQQQQHSYSNTESQQHEQSSYANTSMFAPNHLRRGSLLQSANAAAALAQLHNSRPEPDWQGHHVSTSKSSKSLFITLAQDAYGDTENDQDYMHNYFAHPPSNDIFEDDQQSGDISSHMLQGSSFDRSFLPRSSSTQFPRKPNRPRKSSVTENARKGKHERERSKDLKRLSHDRKSLEPGHKRWEDLLDAAQSATEEESRDLTPVRLVGIMFDFDLLMQYARYHNPLDLQSHRSTQTNFTLILPRHCKTPCCHRIQQMRIHPLTMLQALNHSHPSSRHTTKRPNNSFNRTSTSLPRTPHTRTYTRHTLQQ